MTADVLVEWLSHAIFLLIFFVVLRRAIAAPLVANVDIALFFGALAVVIVIARIFAALGVAPGPEIAAFEGALILALPYLMLRLLDDFAHVRPVVKRAAEVCLALSLITLAVLPASRPPVVDVTLVLGFLVFAVYATVGFLLQTRHTNGVTRRRMYAITLGSMLLAVALFVAGLQVIDPGDTPTWTLANRVLGLLCGLSYFFGFAPPGWLRRAWQEPELRTFLSRAATLPRLRTTRAIVEALEQGAANSLGAPHAAIGIWDEDTLTLHFEMGGDVLQRPPSSIAGGRAFELQRALFIPDTIRADPANADLYRETGALAVVVAPITAGPKRLGVLAAFGARAPIFAEDDLQLVQLLADQAAVILESRALIDEAARVRAKEEAARMKDDFLSSAAHDLKTPLTTILAQAQMLERRTMKHPGSPPDLDGIQRLVRESRRMSDLIHGLLDVGLLEEGRLIGDRELTDLAALAREACGQRSSDLGRCSVEAAEPVPVEVDARRTRQVLDNLIDNAMKYSRVDQPIAISVRREGEEAWLEVTDTGIGIPASDLPHVFERFHRGSNVDDRRFAGMGLGLFICQGIAEQQGGHISVESRQGVGSTFRLVLPLAASAVLEEARA